MSSGASKFKVTTGYTQDPDSEKKTRGSVVILGYVRDSRQAWATCDSVSKTTKNIFKNSIRSILVISLLG